MSFRTLTRMVPLSRTFRTPTVLGARPIQRPELLRNLPLTARFHTTPSPEKTTPLVPPRSPTPPRAIPHQKASAGESGAAPNAGGGEEPLSPAKQAYKLWYGQLFPAMLPVLLLSTAIFLVLSLIRTHLSGYRDLAEKSERIAILESQVERMRAEARRRQERQRREREKILPIVVERVLQHVGAMEPEVEELEEEQELLV